jgi:hypothetical protein
MQYSLLRVFYWTTRHRIDLFLLNMVRAFSLIVWSSEAWMRPNYSPVAKFIAPERVVKLTPTLGCRTGLPVYLAWRAGTTIQCQSWLYPSQGLWIWLKSRLVITWGTALWSAETGPATLFWSADCCAACHNHRVHIGVERRGVLVPYFSPISLVSKYPLSHIVFPLNLRH